MLTLTPTYTYVMSYLSRQIYFLWRYIFYAQSSIFAHLYTPYHIIINITIIELNFYVFHCYSIKPQAAWYGMVYTNVLAKATTMSISKSMTQVVSFNCFLHKCLRRRYKFASHAFWYNLLVIIRIPRSKGIESHQYLAYVQVCMFFKHILLIFSWCFRTFQYYSRSYTSTRLSDLVVLLLYGI